jgi:hypothetical protein
MIYVTLTFCSTQSTYHNSLPARSCTRDSCTHAVEGNQYSLWAQQSSTVPCSLFQDSTAPPHVGEAGSSRQSCWQICSFWLTYHFLVYSMVTLYAQRTVYLSLFRCQMLQVNNLVVLKESTYVPPLSTMQLFTSHE